VNNHAVPSRVIPVLDVGGSHVSAALVDADAGLLVAPACRRSLDGSAPAATILGAFVSAADTLAVPAAASWGVAMPDPFDYARGIALFDGVGKFESLRGHDLRAELTASLPGQPRRIVFLNDADAFTLGEWAHGAGAGYQRCVGLTLGTGIGSGWLVDGRIVADGPGVPPDGRAHRLEIDGGPLEDTVSSRAIRRAYQADTGDAEADVREIARRARAGESAARAVLAYAMRALGAAIGPRVREFGADVVVIGGSMTGSWDLLGPWFMTGFGPSDSGPPITLAVNADDAPLLGAARFAHDDAG
jgi:glucokinase